MRVPFKFFLLAAAFISTCGAAYAANISQTTSSPGTTFEYQKIGTHVCGPAGLCNAKQFTFTTGSESTFGVTFDIAPSLEDRFIEFSIRHANANDGFLISRPTTIWDIKITSNQDSSILYESSINLSGKFPYATTKAIPVFFNQAQSITASISANILHGYSLFPTDNSLCSSISCMDVGKNTVNIFGNVAVGAVPEPSVFLMVAPALLAVGYIARRKQNQ